jgi:hypothetical protein
MRQTAAQRAHNRHNSDDIAGTATPRLKHYNRNRDEETERLVSPQCLVH